MPRKQPANTILLIIVDEDLKVFNLVGPLSDDTEWNHRVAEAQEKGRDIRIEISPHMSAARNEVIAEMRKRLNCEYAEILLV